MQVQVDSTIVKCVERSLLHLHSSQTAPFSEFVQDYFECLQRCRDYEVRVGQLEKEGSELRDENVTLQKRCEKLEECAAEDYQAQAKQLEGTTASLEREVSTLIRDKVKLLEELNELKDKWQSERGVLGELQEKHDAALEEIADLQDEISTLVTSLDMERDARQIASEELQRFKNEYEAAIVEAEKLRTENHQLVNRILAMNERQVEMFNEYNKMSDEKALLQDMVTKQQASTLEKEAIEISRQKGGTVTERLAAALNLGGGGGVTVDGDVGNIGDICLPKLPTKTYAVHKGGCTGLAVQKPGKLIATCGQDSVVALWDTMSLEPNTHGPQILRGMLSSVSDVAFTCDTKALVGAGADKSLRVWDLASGQSRHTLTGHSGPVTCVVTSSTDPGVCISCSEDRSIKMWSLAKGLCTRSLPCTKMPNALTMTRDSLSVVTGHLDGSVCLWDVRAAHSCTPQIEAKDEHVGMIMGLCSGHIDTVVVTACKDNSIRLLDIRTMKTIRAVHQPHFTLGAIGSMGRGRCDVGLTADGRYLAAGGADGSVVVWDLADQSGRERTNVLRGHKDAVASVGWGMSGEGEVLITTDKAGAVCFWQSA